MVRTVEFEEKLSIAFEAFNNGRLDVAEHALEALIEVAPHQPDALHLLGLVYFQSGDLEKACTLIEQAISEDSENSQFFNNLALVLHASGRQKSALEAANKAVFLSPENAGTQTTRGLMLSHCGQDNEAMDAYRTALKLNPQHTQAYINLGVAYSEIGEFSEAESAYRQALDCAPKSKEAISGLGNLFLRLGKNKEAIQLVENQTDEACLDASSLNILAEAYIRENNTQKAVAILEKATKNNPSDALSWNNLGYALRDILEFEKAENALRHAIALEPGHTAAAENLSQILLSLGRFEEGWQYYAKRKPSTTQPFPSTPLDISQIGPAISKAAVITWTEQGLGDEIFQAGLIKDLSRITSQLTVVCSIRLQSLFQKSFPHITVLTYAESDKLNLHAHSIALPLVDTAVSLRANIDDFPKFSGYLSVPKEMVSELRSKYFDEFKRDTILIGISWQSGHALYGKHNTVPLERWKPIFEVAKSTGKSLTFIAVQFGVDATYIEAVSQSVGVPIYFDDFVDHGGDMELVAAQIAAVDLVITTSTTTAQLAGALGRPTIHMTAQGLACGWYWMAEGEHTPWYPSMQIIRRSNGSERQITDAAGALERFVTNS